MSASSSESLPARIRCRGSPRAWPVRSSRTSPRRTAHFAGNHHFVGGRQGFAGDARLGVGAEKEVEHRIGNTVADFIRVTSIRITVNRKLPVRMNVPLLEVRLIEVG